MTLSDNLRMNAGTNKEHIRDVREFIKDLNDEFEKGKQLTKSPNTLLFCKILQENMNKRAGPELANHSHTQTDTVPESVSGVKDKEPDPEVNKVSGSDICERGHTRSIHYPECNCCATNTIKYKKFKQKQDIKGCGKEYDKLLHDENGVPEAVERLKCGKDGLCPECEEK